MVEQCCNNTVIMVEQCCWTNNVVHYCFYNVVRHWWSNNGCWRLLKQEKTILIEQACRYCYHCCSILWHHCSLGAAQHCSQLAAQHCSCLLTTNSNRLCAFTRVAFNISNILFEPKLERNQKMNWNILPVQKKFKWKIICREFSYLKVKTKFDHKWFSLTWLGFMYTNIPHIYHLLFESLVIEGKTSAHINTYVYIASYSYNIASFLRNVGFKLL